MGLDTSHGCWHGAYSAFNRWRDHVARSAGYTFIKPEGEYRESADIDWDRFTEANLYGEWAAEETDPLLYLMVHSDCDGVIHPAQAKPLADRLAEILPKLDEGKSGGHIYSMRGCTEQFIAGLRAAVDNDEPVEFG